MSRSERDEGGPRGGAGSGIIRNLYASRRARREVKEKPVHPKVSSRRALEILLMGRLL